MIARSATRPAERQPLNIKLDPKVTLKNPAAHTVVGQSIPRVDIPAKVTGQFTYVHDFRLPGMLHARVVRPAGRGAPRWSAWTSPRSRPITGGVKGAQAGLPGRGVPDRVGRGEGGADAQDAVDGGHAARPGKAVRVLARLPVGKDEPVIRPGTPWPRWARRPSV